MNRQHAVSTAFALTLFAGIISAPRTATAQLIAADSYRIGSNLANGEYPLNANATVGNPNAGTQLFNTAALGASSNTETAGRLITPGFTNGRYGSGNGTAQFAATAGGLAYAPLGITAGDSGKVTYTASPLDAIVRNTARTLNPVPASSTTYWISSLVRRDAVSGSTPLGYVMGGFGGTLTATSLNIGATSAPGLFFGYSGDAGNLALRYRNTGGTTAEEVLLAGSPSLNNVTNALLFKIDVNFAGAADRVTYWVNPTNFTNEATLTSTAAATAALTGTTVISANTDFTRLTYITSRWNSGAAFDEMRLGTTLASVTPGAVAVVPEPGTLAFLGIGGVALLGVVRRRAS